jgi:hypothetical protein
MKYSIPDWTSRDREICQELSELAGDLRARLDRETSKLAACGAAYTRQRPDTVSARLASLQGSLREASVCLTRDYLTRPLVRATKDSWTLTRAPYEGSPALSSAPSKTERAIVTRITRLLDEAASLGRMVDDEEESWKTRKLLP